MMNVGGSDAAIIAGCLAHGIDRQRLEACLSSHDNWGKMIHAFEYLTVLEVVLNAMKASPEPTPVEGHNGTA